MPITMSGNEDRVIRDDAFPRWKRNLDVVLVLLSLPVTLPLTAAIALLIRLSSAGPIVFQQERVGQAGRRFMCLKFRTMKIGADEGPHKHHLHRLTRSNAPMIKLDLAGDSRVVPCCAWLRAAGLDELPQLLNIWRGEMSLVGPRPCLPYEYDHYSEAEKHRLDARPGLTGYWQVSGKNLTTHEQMIRMDVWYAAHLSFWLDVSIILKTIPALISQAWHMRALRNAPAPGRPNQQHQPVQTI